MLRLKKPDGIAIKSVLVAVSGNSADEDAVRFAAQLTEPQRGSIYIVHVIEVERSLPVDSDLSFHTTRGDDLLDRDGTNRTALQMRGPLGTASGTSGGTRYSPRSGREGSGRSGYRNAVQDQVRQIRAGRRCAVCTRTRAVPCPFYGGMRNRKK